MKITTTTTTMMMMMVMRSLIVILGMRMHEYDNEDDAGACCHGDGEYIISPIGCVSP